MSLSEEDRKTIVQLEIQKAEQTFAEKDILVPGGLWNTLANRLYYSLFHAISALLIYDHHEVGTHKGAVIRFHQHYVQTGLFTKEEGYFYSQLQTLREKGDYNCYFDVSKEDVLSRIEPTRQLIAKIKQYITEERC